MKNTLGIIISFDTDHTLGELSEHRPVASVPVGGRYRAIDFMLSNFVNSGCYQVGILMRDKYQSLMDHLGSGKDYDLSRKRGGMMLIPPNAFAKKSSTLVTGSVRSKMEALGSIGYLLQSSRYDHVIIADGDVVANVPLDEVLKEHKESGADMTLVCTKTSECGVGDVFMSLSPRHEVNDLRRSDNDSGKCKYKSLGIYVVGRAYLLQLLKDCVTHSLRSFESDALQHVFQTGTLHGYVFEKYAAKLEDVKGYFSASMDLLDKDIRDQVFVKSRPILTKIHDEAPAFYAATASVSDSLISDGSVIRGTVENSIISRGVVIEEGAVVRDSIIMQGCHVGKDVELSYVVADKNVVIRDNHRLMGQATFPVAINKGAIV